MDINSELRAHVEIELVLLLPETLTSGAKNDTISMNLRGACERNF